MPTIALRLQSSDIRLASRFLQAMARTFYLTVSPMFSSIVGKHSARFLPGALAGAAIAGLFSFYDIDSSAGSSAIFQHYPICGRSGSALGVTSGWDADLAMGLKMAVAMTLIGFVPWRWSGRSALACAAIAAVWVLGLGGLYEIIHLGASFASMTSSALDRSVKIAALAVCVAGALQVNRLQGCRRHHADTAFRDGCLCLVRCSPMMAAMMLTGAMSAAWMLLGALITQADEVIAERRLSRLLILGAGTAGIIAITAGR